jgi:hypothetical protein
MTTTPAPTTTSVYPSTALDCNFDSNNTCEWFNDNSDFYWTLNKGETKTPFTGPSFDHTTQSTKGYYIYIDSSPPQKTGQSARLLSPNVEMKAGGCFKFFYHMFGVNVYQLSVYTDPVIEDGNDDDEEETKPVWTKQGNKGDKWLFGHVYLENDPGVLHTRLILEGTIGKGVMGGEIRFSFKLSFFEFIKTIFQIKTRYCCR